MHEESCVSGVRRGSSVLAVSSSLRERDTVGCLGGILGFGASEILDDWDQVSWGRSALDFALPRNVLPWKVNTAQSILLGILILNIYAALD